MKEIILLISLLLAGCEKDFELINEDIYGTWEQYYQYKVRSDYSKTPVNTLTFHNNQTVVFSNSKLTATGTFKINQDVITINIEHENGFEYKTKSTFYIRGKMLEFNLSNCNNCSAVMFKKLTK